MLKNGEKLLMQLAWQTFSGGSKELQRKVDDDDDDEESDNNDDG
jgi:hypothetical protein